jgi:hypothetical protein
MKGFIPLACLVLMAIPGSVSGEPLSFEQAANVTGFHGGVEYGLDAAYGLAFVPRLDQRTIARRVFEVPLVLHLGWPALEFSLDMPYANIRTDPAESRQVYFSGFRGIGAGAKYNVFVLPLLTLGAGVQGHLPILGQDQWLYGEGLSVYPFVAGDVITNYFIFHLHIGWNYGVPYQRLQEEGNNTVTFKPADTLRIALGAETEIDHGFWFLLEAADLAYGQAFSGGEYLPQSDRTIFTLTPGFRFQSSPFKFKAGVQIPLSGANRWPAFAPTYDWLILAGVSLVYPFP